jgi:hypothetical protein
MVELPLAPGLFDLTTKLFNLPNNRRQKCEGEDLDSIGGCTSGLAASIRQPSFQSPASA